MQRRTEPLIFIVEDSSYNKLVANYAIKKIHPRREFLVVKSV